MSNSATSSSALKHFLFPVELNAKAIKSILGGMLACMAIVFVGYALLLVISISRSTSSTAAIGYIFVPFAALFTAAKMWFYALAISYALYVVRHKHSKINLFFITCVAILLYGSWTAGNCVVEIFQTKMIIHRAETSINPKEIDVIYHNSQKFPMDRQKYILEAIALNPSTSQETLNNISQLKDQLLHERIDSLFYYQPRNRKGFAVMRLVAMHPHANKQTLEILSQSASLFVVEEVAKNQNTPDDLIKALWEKYGEKIAYGISQNPKTPPEILVALYNMKFDPKQAFSKMQEEWIKANIAKNPNTPTEILEQLKDEQSWLILQFLIDNEKIPSSILEDLTHHQNETVSAYAKDKLKRMHDIPPR